MAPTSKAPSKSTRVQKRNLAGMHSPGPPRRARAHRQPRPSSFRPHSPLFSTAAPRSGRGAVRLLYQPFLTSASGSASVKGGIDILDAHSGALRLRIFLPQQFLTDVDGLHGSFLATDENGQRLFAITSSDGTP